MEKLEFRVYLCISKQALVDQAKKAGSNHYFIILRLYLWPMWPLGHAFSKGYIFQTVTLSLMVTIKVE